MNKLWVFGDSFSMDYNKDSAPWCVEYVKWKGGNVKTYGHFVSEYFNLELVNKASGGNDNFTIFNDLCDNIDLINEDDFVIIGWAPVSRFRIVNHKINCWNIVSGYSYDDNNDFIENINYRTIREIQINRDHKLYLDELKSWEKIIYKSLKNNKIFIWKWSGFDANRLNQVCQETNNVITDCHWSEDGHRDFSKEVIEKIKNNE